MAKIDPDLFEAAHAAGLTVLKEFDSSAKADFVTNTHKHLVVRAVSEQGNLFCVKVNLEAVKAGMTDSGSFSDLLEIRAFELIGEKSWAPRLLGYSETGAWLLREWVGQNTLDKIEKSAWPKHRLDKLWSMFADAFGVFHAMNDPHLIRDIKSANVSFDADEFYLFDFNTVKSLGKIRQSFTKSRFGNLRNRYLSPETLSGDFTDVGLDSDFFSFASIFHQFAVGLERAVWSNSESHPEAALKQYHDEYNALKDPYSARLKDLGYSLTEIDFLIACLHPSNKQRPTAFMPPQDCIDSGP